MQRRHLAVDQTHGEMGTGKTKACLPWSITAPAAITQTRLGVRVQWTVFRRRPVLRVPL